MGCVLIGVCFEYFFVVCEGEGWSVCVVLLEYFGSDVFFYVVLDDGICVIVCVDGCVSFSVGEVVMFVLIGEYIYCFDQVGSCF